MRIPKYTLVLVAAATFVAGACSDSDDDGPAADGGSATTEASSDATGDELDDDVAAVVDGEEISASSIDEAVDGLAESPQFSEQLAGPDGDAARAELAAQILSSAITTNIVSSSADALGQPVTDEDLADARRELEEQVGGADALDAAAEQQGLTASLLDQELTSLAAMRNVQEALDQEAGDGSSSTAPEATDPADPELTPSEQRLQQFLLDAVADADVTVHEDYGVWDPATAQVTPPGAAPAPAPGG